jgi:hypothetical protein
MTPETINAIKDALKPLAEKLGTTAEATWPIVVEQQKVDAITEGMWVVGVSIMTAGTFKWFLWALSRDMCHGAFCETNAQAVFAGGLTFLGLLLIMFGLTTIVNKLLNPQFQALDYFLQLVGKDKE